MDGCGINTAVAGDDRSLGRGQGGVLRGRFAGVAPGLVVRRRLGVGDRGVEPGEIRFGLGGRRERLVEEARVAGRVRGVRLRPFDGLRDGRNGRRSRLRL